MTLFRMHILYMSWPIVQVHRATYDGEGGGREKHPNIRDVLRASLSTL